MTSPEKIKVVLIGETMTGKTSLIKRLIENTFEEESASTLVATTVTKTFTYEGRQLTLDIWDTAGQEKFRSLNKVFYKSAIIIILVYNITERNTFEQIVDYWYNEVKTRCIKNPIIAIVGNKSDLNTARTIKTGKGINEAFTSI